MRAGEGGASAPSAVNTLAWTQQSAHRANVILRANVRACVCGARSAARDGWLARCDPRASYIGLLEVLGRHVVGARGCLALLLARSFPHPGRLFVFVRARWGKNCLWRAAAGPGGVLPKPPAHRVLRRRPVAHGTALHALALEDAGCGHTRGVTPGVPEACGGRDIPDFSLSCGDGRAGPRDFPKCFFSRTRNEWTELSLALCLPPPPPRPSLYSRRRQSTDDDHDAAVAHRRHDDADRGAPPQPSRSRRSSDGIIIQ